METEVNPRDRNEVRPPRSERHAVAEARHWDRAGGEDPRAGSPRREGVLDPCGPEAGAIEYDSWRLP